ncbi:MAG: LacI family transcriptional regulator [Clostridiales Family XIII bacterium]|jgi:DNA-binding LacI/PurR family transcriptional regulator|nr:LacI family transcriptional regulator [Clostridiales Family XIII bacterium]
MAPTIKDISKNTGLGLATISKYLNGGNVLPENKVAIEKAIDELHYSVNELARGLKTRKTKTIGIVIPELDNLFFMRVIKAIEYPLRKEGYAVIISDCHGKLNAEVESINFLLDKKVDGIINFPANPSGKHLIAALEKHIPVLMVDRLAPKLIGKVDSISIDNDNISREATDLLIEKGHRNIGVLVGSTNIYTSEQRLKGYCDSLREHGIELGQDYIQRCEYSVEGGYKGFKRLMAKNKDMTAVFATNYDTTLGVLMAIGDCGLKMPDDISFLGFDNMDWAKIIVPSLTIVEQPLRQIGLQAAEIMLKRLRSSKDLARQSVVLSAKLNIGGSIKDIR